MSPVAVGPAVVGDPVGALVPVMISPPAAPESTKLLGVVPNLEPNSQHDGYQSIGNPHQP